MKFELVSEDVRGWIGLVKLPNDREVIMIFTRKGFLRGGEYHKSVQHDLILHGSLRWTPKRRVQKAGRIGVISAYQPHLAEALEDTLYIEWLTGEFEKTFVPELRKLVDEQMKK